jgi:nucleoside 2-deoxyribosyltransferase
MIRMEEKMKIYLANFFSKKDQVAVYAKELIALGHIVTSRWFNEAVPHTVTLDQLPYKYHEETAIADLEDMRTADVLILFTGNEHDYTTIPAGSLARGGRHFESGFFYSLGKAIILCGQRENIFHYLPDVRQFDTWEQTKEYLSGR